MSVSKLIPMLEQVREMLGVKCDGPGTQQKASQSNKASAAAAKAKLDALDAKTKAGVTDTTTVQAHSGRYPTSK